MVDEHWLTGFRHTVGDFQQRHGGNGQVVSIKVRVESGCFHRSCSPEAYKIIDAQLRRPPKDVEVIEHESGPIFSTIIVAMPSFSPNLFRSGWAKR